MIETRNESYEEEHTKEWKQCNKSCSRLENDTVWISIYMCHRFGGAWCFHIQGNSNSFWTTLKIQATDSSHTLVSIYQYTRRHKREEWTRSIPLWEPHMSQGPVQVVFAEGRLPTALLLSLWPLVAGSRVLHVLKIAFQRLMSGPVIIPNKDTLQ